MLSNFYYHPRMLAYDFGPQHPLRPERLRRAIQLLESFGVSPLDPGVGSREDALRVHSAEFVAAVERLSKEPRSDFEHGFGAGDNPAFAGMYEASLAYTAGTVQAAKDVRDGAPVAFNISGGLHHAVRGKASGFCIFDDPAIALHVLLEKYSRVAYVDIDLHHGDGVQWIWYDDPRVLTCSIHQDGRTLFPGSGGVEETGEAFTSINVPMWPGTTGDTWLWSFSTVIMEALKLFRPEAIVLQMGTDAHPTDPLGHLQVTSQEWCQAVRMVRSLGLPIVAVGGGGYDKRNVPRMWAAACLLLGGWELPDVPGVVLAPGEREGDFEGAPEIPADLPAELQEELQFQTFFDPALPLPRGQGREEAEQVVHWHERFTLPHIS